MGVPCSRDFSIYRDGWIAMVEPDLPACVLQGLTRNGRVFRLGGPRGFQLEEANESVTWLDDRRRRIILAGLIPRISQELNAAGYRVQVQDPCDFRPAERTWEPFAYDDSQTASLLELLDREPRGQIEIVARSNLVRAVELVSRFFTGRIAVICPTHKIAYRLVDKLSARMAEPIGAPDQRAQDDGLPHRGR